MVDIRLKSQRTSTRDKHQKTQFKRFAYETITIYSSIALYWLKRFMQEGLVIPMQN